MKTYLKNNLRAVRKKLRDSREIVRLLIGQPFKKSHKNKLLDLNKKYPLTIKNYPSNPEYKVSIITPDDGHYMHTFFDISPVSPSGRYILVTKIPFLWRLPTIGDTAQVCIIDLIDKTIKPIYNTTGWGTQLGSNAQWGCDDETVLFNIVHEGIGKGVCLNLKNNSLSVLDGPIYGVSPDKRYSYSSPLEHVNLAQTGYGIPEPIFKKTLSNKQAGIWKTDLFSGESRLILSTKKIIELPDFDKNLKLGNTYIFNVKVNPQNDRILAVLFTIGAPNRLGWPTNLITCDTDGNNLQLVLSDAIWRKGGHHPNWHPNGTDIVMNLKDENGIMRFAILSESGRKIDFIGKNIKGSGHPSINSACTNILTDSYVTEGFSDKRGYVPIRLIDLHDMSESEICRVYTNNITGGRRVDPHPVWESNGKKIVFNATFNGKKCVMIAERNIK